MTDVKSKVQRIIRFKSNAQDSNWETLGKMVANKDGSSQIYFDYIPSYMSITDEYGNTYYRIPAELTAFPPDSGNKTKAKAKAPTKPKTQATGDPLAQAGF